MVDKNLEPSVAGSFCSARACQFYTNLLLFCVIYRENYYLSQVLDHNDLSTVSATNFKPLRPTKFIIHGFVSSGSANWIKVTRSNQILYVLNNLKKQF